MDAVTYPNEEVAEFINNNVIPLRLASDTQPTAKNFNITWTPALLILDHTGIEHHRSIGFLQPMELIPSILLGIGKVYYDKNEFQEANNYFEQILAQYPESDSTPEAVFLIGVSRYKSMHNPQPLKEAYEVLQKNYSQSSWTKKAYPYRLL